MPRRRTTADARPHVVTLVDDVGTSGGGERFARDLCLNLDAERFERTFCVTRWWDERIDEPGVRDLVGELEGAGVRFLGLRRRSVRDLAAWRPLVRMIRAGEVDVLHAHKFGSNVWGAAFSLLRALPVFVAHEQTWSYEGKPVRKLLDRALIARRADRFIAVSEKDKRSMVEIERIDPAKLLVMPNAIPTPASSDGGERVRAELGLSAGDQLVGAVCVLRPQKRLDVMLRAIAIVREEFPRVKLLLAGAGEERDHLERVIAELELDDCAHLLGQRTDVPDFLDALDVAALSSDYEGTPLAVMEYMEAALPIASTAAGGVPEMIENGVHGLIVETGDHAALAAAIARLLREPDLAAELGRNARARRREHYDTRAAAERVGDLYTGLLAAARGGDS